MSFEEPSCLLGIGTAVPEAIFPKDEFIKLQKEAAIFAIGKLNPNDAKDKARIDEINKNCEWVVNCAENSGIDKRHGIVPEEGKTIQEYYKKYDFNPPYTLRARYWRKYCPGLAMKAVEKCLQVWGGDSKLVTHVVSHSTTGWDVPGLSHHIIYNLDLPESARAVPVNYVGCQGGTSVLYVASMIARQNPDAVILALAAEIQSPLGRMYNDDVSLERSIFMPNVLFGDAAACAIIARPNFAVKNNFPLWEIGDQHAHYIPNTRHVLTISVSEELGLYYENSIKKELPIHLNAALSKNYGDWHKKVCELSPKDCAFAVHPGGLRLLDNFSTLIENYGIPNGKKACEYSYKNLQLYGNLASAAILFILNDVCNNTDKNEIYFMAMGPGVCLEYGGMKRYKKGSRVKKSNNSNNNNSNSNLLLIFIFISTILLVLFSKFNLQDLSKWL